jgi:Cu/Ag efflux pump CusA
MSRLPRSGFFCFTRSHEDAVLGGIWALHLRGFVSSCEKNCGFAAVATVEGLTACASARNRTRHDTAT